VTTRQPKLHTQLAEAAVQTFAANERMNQMLIEHLDPAAWRANPPGKKRARTIAAIFTHMHNVRCKWVTLTDPHLKIPSRAGLYCLRISPDSDCQPRWEAGTRKNRGMRTERQPAPGAIISQICDANHCLPLSAWCNLHGEQESPLCRHNPYQPN
jgi:hypothetical protein